MYTLSLAELSIAIKMLLEVNFESIKVKGEAVQPKRHGSGHLYFTLKDGDYNLDCVAWRNTKLEFEPKDGSEIICTGKITSYPGRSKYQMNISQVENSGLGIAMQAIENLKKKLLAEGLFDISKRPKIPPFPKSIGILTSATGAVIYDMLHRLRDRYPIPVYLYPIPVQGPDMARKAINGIMYFTNMVNDETVIDAQTAQMMVDVIIIARGGGSFEDLIGFNDEELVRAVAASRIPIVTAIGHETDTTLIDYVSSLRAPTPTAAIELITPDRNSLISAIQDLSDQMTSYVSRHIRNSDIILQKSSRFNVNSIVEFGLQKIDYTIMDFEKSAGLYMNARANRLSIILQKPHLDRHTSFIEHKYHLMKTILQSNFDTSASRLENISKLLQAVCYKSTLDRGFCRAFSKKNGLIPTKQAAIILKEFVVEFSDGSVEVKI